MNGLSKTGLTQKGLTKKGKLVLAVSLLAIVALVAAACGDDDSSVPVGSVGSFDTFAAELARSVATDDAAGIHVTGIGQVTVEPDIALLSIGVEGIGATVTEARDIAANAIDGMLDALRARGVSENDAKTTFFNIQPQYEFREVVNGFRHTERVLVGYIVTNTLEVTVLDLDRVGDVIDGAVSAGGDATRINSVRFDIEDRTGAQEEARLLALRSAVARADLFAKETGVKRGSLIFITETSAPAPAIDQARFLEAVSSDGAFAAPTPIIAGDLDVTVSIRAVFAIE